MPPLIRRLALLLAIAMAQPGAARTLYTGGLVVDPSREAAPRRLDVAVDRGRIVAVGPHLPRRGARIVPLDGRYLVPGLWDMHAHVAAVGPVGDALDDYVRHGVLGIRDMGGRVDEILSLRADVAAGRRRGPTMYVAGPTLNGEQAADFHRLVRNAAEARAAVRELRLRGVDFIKIHRQTSRDAFYGVRDQARREGLDFAGHVPLAMSWIEGADGGMRSIEHVQTIIENEIDGRAPDKVRATFEALDRLDGSRGDLIFAAMARNHTYWTPTLVFYRWSWEGDPDQLRALKQRAYAQMRPYVARAARAGVPILAGTDLLAKRGEGLLDELDQLVAAGLSPREAIAAATTTPFGLVRRGPGPIVRGGEASFLVVRANPLADVTALRRPSLILLRGRPVDPAPSAAR